MSIEVNTGDQFNVTIQGGDTPSTSVTVPAAIGNVGPQGVTGPTGPQGIQGLIGPTGAQGVTGDRGATGLGGALGSYGSFYDATDQAIAVVDTGQAVTIDSAFGSNGISIVDGSKITIANPGTYQLTAVLQVANADNSDSHYAFFWLKFNGVDYPNSGTELFMSAAKNSNDPNYKLVTITFIGTSTAADDYVQIYWSGDSTDLSLSHTDATASHPAVPSAIVSIQQVMYTQLGPTGATGDKGDTGERGQTGPTGAKGATGDTGPQGPQGEQGIQGIQGLQGDKGTTGERGATGDAGSDGERGPTGPTGVQGVPGNDGADGADGARGATGPTGDPGPAGSDGADGATGVGVPAGGTAGYILAKASNTDYDTEWIVAPSGGTGGGLTEIVQDTTPELGGDLWIGNNKIQFPSTFGTTGGIYVSGVTDDLYITTSSFSDINIDSGDNISITGDDLSATLSSFNVTTTGGITLDSGDGTNGIEITGGSVDITSYISKDITITSGSGADLIMQGFTFPKTDGGVGDVLTTDGSKVLSFTSLSAVSGATGPTGPTGAKGATGDPGADGVDGVDGQRGPTGPTGLQGVPGADGVDGVDGERGPTGPTGLQGVPGVDGTDGADGARGATGPTGAPGTNGVDGVDGDRGPTGPTGAKGTTGDTGPQGEQGLRGQTGPTGAPGTDGTNGADGERGPTGPTGLQGAPGVDGVDGADGERGPTGPTGLKGDTGDQGLRGQTGPTGLPGADGADGADGSRGPTGPTGLPGADGADGTNGVDGERGPTGPTGTPGTNGVDGVDGVDGDRGPTGPTGLQGVPGNDGADGVDGLNGATGPTGVGVPAGGTSGYVLAKASNTDYDTTWVAAAAGGTGGGLGTTDQTLTADRTITTAGYNLDVAMTSGDTVTFHDGTNDLFQIDTNTIGTLFSVNDVSGLPMFEVESSGQVAVPTIATAAPSGTVSEGTMQFAIISGSYYLYAYLGGGWRSVQLT